MNIKTKVGKYMIKCNLKQLIEKTNSVLIKQDQVTINGISKKTGISRTSLRALYSNKSKGMTFSTISKLMEYFNVPMNKLMTYYQPITLIKMYKLPDILSSKEFKPKELSREIFDEFFNDSITLDITQDKSWYSVSALAIKHRPKHKKEFIQIGLIGEHTKTNPLIYLSDESLKKIVSVIIFNTIDLKKYKDDEKVPYALSNTYFIDYLYTNVMTKYEIISNSKWDHMEAYYKNSDYHFTIQNKIK